MSLDKFEIKRIAGIAYLQTRIRQLDPMYNYVTIDGMVGNDTKTAWREILEVALGIVPPFQMPIFDSNAITYIQSCIVAAFKLKPNYAKPPFIVDGQWGDDTKAAIDKVIDMYVDRVIVRNSIPTSRLSERTLNSMRGKVRLNHGRVEGIAQYHGPDGDKVEGFHWFENLPHEQNQDVCDLLAKAMGFENAVISPAHMVGAGFVIGIHWYQGTPCGIVVWRTAHTLELKVYGECEGEYGNSRVAYLSGIYVNQAFRDRGIGTGMLAGSRLHMKDLGYIELRFAKERRNEQVEERLFRTLTVGLGYVEYDPMNTPPGKIETHCRHKL